MRALLCLVVPLALAACKAPEKPAPPITQSTELVVITVDGPATYYHDAEGRHAGLEFDLAAMFAAEIGKSVRFVVVPRLSEVLPALHKHSAHLAAAGFTVTKLLSEPVYMGPIYHVVQHHVVYNSDYNPPRDIAGLAGKSVRAVAGNGYGAILRDWAQQAPGMSWSEEQAADEDALLGRLANGEIDAVLTNSSHLDVSRHFYPNLGSAFPLEGHAGLAWAFPIDADPWLLERAGVFFRRIAGDGTLDRLIDRYFGHMKRLTATDVETFLQKTQLVLPNFREYFRLAGEITGIDWRLLAALGYQESQWNPLATSPTGVRGLMMLTADTADRLMVTDRLDPRQSILAGSRYFADLKDQLDSVPEPDRTWLALAAYNLGMGHLQGGRQLARSLKLDPNSWAAMKKMLPLMSRPEYAARLKSGAARGGEAVILTENIRTYYQILSRVEPPARPSYPAPRLNVTVEKPSPG
ncbi:MAG TPA: membrane-bound lytic murein transglycosylase MltF [Burkholderiales bacterium]|nr:membrane-bound lytic murein transglycosylase MltF [Burkholderiales bacterium]